MGANNEDRGDAPKALDGTKLAWVSEPTSGHVAWKAYLDPFDVPLALVAHGEHV